MDPNSGKKDMFNKLSKELALKKLYEEQFARRTISFYRYVIIQEPAAVEIEAARRRRRRRVEGGHRTARLG